MLKRKTEIYLIIITLLLYLFRGVVPIFKYPFLLLTLVLTINLLIFKRKNILKDIKMFFKGFYLFILLLFFFMISSFLTHKIYLEVIKEIINGFILIYLFILILFTVKSKKELSSFLKNLINIILLFAVYIFLIRTLDFFEIFSFDNLLTNNIATKDNTNVIDLNFALIPFFFAIISILILFVNGTNSKYKKLYYLLLILFTLYIATSGSRRGLILLVVILSILLVLQMYYFFNRMEFIYRIRTATISMVVSILFIGLVLFGFVYFIPTKLRVQFVKLVGLESIKGKVASKLYRYNSIFDNSKTYSDFYKEIWIPEFDPRDPESGWGRRTHEKIFPLKGENVGIIPDGSIGYKMDSTCNASFNSIFNLSESYSLLSNLKIKKGEKYQSGKGYYGKRAEK